MAFKTAPADALFVIGSGLKVIGTVEAQSTQSCGFKMEYLVTYTNSAGINVLLTFIQLKDG